MNGVAAKLKGNGVPLREEDLQIGSTREYGISDVIFAGDRGMLTPKRIEEVNAVGFKTLTALTHPQMADLLERTVVSP